MARIRSIKPEFWTSEQVMDCAPVTRLLFIGMWNFADDHGRMPLAPRTIKAQVFPGDEIAPDDVRRMIVELSSNGLLLIYTHEGREYLEITGWSHQKIDRPQAPKYPAPFVEENQQAPVPLDDHSTNDRRTFATDRRGEEGIGKERIVGEDAPSSSKVPFFESGVIRLKQKDFEKWRDAFSNLDLKAELIGLTEWAAGQESWFFAVSSALAKKNREMGLRREGVRMLETKPQRGIPGII
jgi:hypothetical protein